MRSFLPIILSLLAGCSPIPRPGPSDSRPIINLVWSRAFSRDSVNAWDRQIESRWPGRKCVALFCHGVDDPIPPFRLIPDRPLDVNPAENTAKLIRTLWPDRLLVLVSCNPSHQMIRTRGVAYSPWNTWIMPGGDVRPGFSDGELVVKSGAGSINDFVINESENR